MSVYLSKSPEFQSYSWHIDGKTETDQKKKTKKTLVNHIETVAGWNQISLRSLPNQTMILRFSESISEGSLCSH